MASLVVRPPHARGGDRLDPRDQPAATADSELLLTIRSGHELYAWVHPRRPLLIGTL